MNTIQLKIAIGFLMSLSFMSLDANQAVSGLNGKIDSAYGNLNSSEGWISEGSASVPIAETLGFQFDALYADVEDVDFAGIGGHFFWRDYKEGLLGFAFGGVFGDEVDSFEFSIEGEYYLDWLTIGAKAGYAAIEYEDEVPFIETDEDGVFGLLYATFYPVEYLSLTIGVENRFDNNSARFDAEYELPIDGLSIFSRATVADNDYDHLLFGIRYYFGGDKSLKKRHRHDDPRSVVQDILFGVGTYGAEYNKRGNEYIRENGGSGSLGSFGVVNTIAEFDPVGAIGWLTDPIGPGTAP